MDNIDVSIVIISYNPTWEKLLVTISSAIKQEDIASEIIVADDGSDNNFFERIKYIFRINNFTRYNLVGSEQNHGTCKNIIKVMDLIHGKFIKLLSPGDYFVSNNSLKGWITFMNSNNIDISFGDAFFYNVDKYNKKKLIKVKEKPQNISIYDLEYSGKNRNNLQFINYILLKDAPIGACFLTLTKLFKKYIVEIEDKIIYSEDVIYRLMITDNIEIYHFPESIIWYEYGTGISTSGKSKWNNVIQNEYRVCNEMIEERLEKAHGWINRKKHNALDCLMNNKREYIKYIIFPNLIIWKFKKDIGNRYSKETDN